MSSESLRCLLKYCICLKGPAIRPGQQAKLCASVVYAWPLFSFHLTVPSFGKCGSEGSPLPNSIVLAVGQTMLWACTSLDPAIWKQGRSLLYSAGERLEQLSDAMSYSVSHFQDVKQLALPRASWLSLSSCSSGSLLPVIAFQCSSSDRYE